MSIIDISEEIVSEVDVNVELDAEGVRVSVYVDECEVADFVDYQTMAYRMVADKEKYPNEVLSTIADELAKVVDIFEEATKALWFEDDE
jgi:hypothetical protein